MIAYVPVGLELVAEVENPSVNVSPFTAPLNTPESVGLAVPYARVTLFAPMLREALLTFNTTLLVSL
jgi:hypothetical protein